MGFPDSFVWGAASSAYQVEGAARADGRGDSVWDVFCRRPGAVWGGHTGDEACDHYRRFRDDVRLMRDIGLRAYRFSIAWPRVMPQGDGPINEPGLAFYDALVDELLAAGIEPWVTLFHWDLPQAVQERGGWLNRESAAWFHRYAAAVAKRLSDRVTRWITINEPQIYIGLGHKDGVNAPGVQLQAAEHLQAAHHTLLAHGRAVEAIREHARRPPTVGWAPIGAVKYPATESPADVDAARRAMHAVTKRDYWNSAWFADAVLRGRYPEDGLRLWGDDAPRVRDGDMDVIARPIDFYGVNIYDGEPVRAGPDGEPAIVARAPGHPQTAIDWFLAPEALYWGPRFLHERYGLPIVVTENGLSNVDWPGLDGRVRDPQRIDYTRRSLLQLRRAADDGVDVRGYFHWSVMDNFEWSHGYKERFGLIYVDYATQRRTPKDSAGWYRRVIETNGAALDEDPETILGAAAEAR